MVMAYDSVLLLFCAHRVLHVGATGRPVLVARTHIFLENERYDGRSTLE
jgi:hypothetical protein